jgi:hypothetical protein
VSNQRPHQVLAPVVIVSTSERLAYMLVLVDECMVSINHVLGNSADRYHGLQRANDDSHTIVVGKVVLMCGMLPGSSTDGPWQGPSFAKFPTYHAYF